MKAPISDPKDVQVYFEGTFSKARNGAMLELMGSDATLYFDRGRYEIYSERLRKEPPPRRWCSANANSAAAAT